MLTRVAGLFSGRGFNIESLCVAETLDPTISAMTIVTRGSEAILEQILKQLNKLINVIKVVDFEGWSTCRGRWCSLNCGRREEQGRDLTWRTSFEGG